MEGEKHMHASFWSLLLIPFSLILFLYFLHWIYRNLLSCIYRPDSSLDNVGSHRLVTDIPATTGASFGECIKVHWPFISSVVHYLRVTMFPYVFHNCGGKNQIEKGCWNDLGRAGQEIVCYESPRPTVGIHRFVFVLFRQLGRQTVYAPGWRQNFNTRDFAELYNLGSPVAALYFNCQRESGSGGRRRWASIIFPTYFSNRTIFLEALYM